MFHFDLRTIAWMSLGGSALLAVVLFSLWRNYPRNIAGLKEWALAAGALALAALMQALQGTLPAFMSVSLGTMLQLGAGVLLYAGIERFHDQQPSFQRLLWQVFAGWCVLLLLLAIWPHYGAQSIAAGLFQGGLAAAMVVLLLRHGAQTFPAQLIAAALAWLMLVLLFHMGASWDRARTPEVFESVAAHTLHGVSQAAVWLTVLVGLVLLASAKLQKELEYLSTHDPLTHVLTRRSMIDACERELDRCRRHHRDMALLLLDLDHFKHINEVRGQAVGDEVLLDFVARVYDVLRRTDLLGRYDGEAFAVLLPETGPREALMVAERIRNRTAALHLSLPPYTVSIGATVNLPGEDQVDMLVKRADQALRQAKAAGRDQVAFI